MARVSPYFDIKRDDEGHEYMEVYLEGIAVLRLVLTNKGTAFSAEERIELGLEGLLPPQINTLEQQIQRVYQGYLRMPTNLTKYQFLRALQERQEILFYGLLERHLEEMMPIVYTPTVGQAVQQFSALYQKPRGICLSPENAARAEVILDSYALEDVRMIVATDSSAILGIGDQGFGGLAIPIGKLALYTVGGGVSPFHTMPVGLDVGTDRLELREDPFYLGLRRPRLRGAEYDALIEAFVQAVKSRWPKAIVQWEDLSKEAAFAVLERYRDELPSFNDDIQGTGAVALSGALSGCRLKGESLEEQTFVVHGAGAGGIGVAWALTQGLMHEGLSREEARARVLVLDSRGLLLEGRAMEAYKASYAQSPARIAGWECAGEIPTLLETVRASGASVLLGLSGSAGAFDASIARAMAANVARPMIFPLSNPTDSAEALPEDLYRWTEGRAIVATGSPFEPVLFEGVEHPVGQGNNAFIFPGLGFGAILTEARKITDGLVLEAAYALTDYTAERYLEQGLIYPPIADLREASVRVTARVLRRAVEEGVAGREGLPETLEQAESFVRERFWHPRYLPVVRGYIPPIRKPESDLPQGQGAKKPVWDGG